MTPDFSPELDLTSRWMNQAGTLGFSPMISPAVKDNIFITNPVSYHPRMPSANRDLSAFAGGFLLHTGLPNPGWKAVRKKYAAHWSRYHLPVWVHLVEQDMDDLKKIVLECEEMDGIGAIEIGSPPGCPADLMREMVKYASGEIPLILSISAGDAPGLIPDIPKEVSAVTLAAPRGRLQSLDGNMISGRLHGPGLFPGMLEVLHTMQGVNIPILFGGVCNLEDGETALRNGAAAVQMDRLCWMGALPGFKSQNDA